MKSWIRRKLMFTLCAHNYVYFKMGAAHKHNMNNKFRVTCCYCNQVFYKMGYELTNYKTVKDGEIFVGRFK